MELKSCQEKIQYGRKINFIQTIKKNKTKEIL